MGHILEVSEQRMEALNYEYMNMNDKALTHKKGATNDTGSITITDGSHTYSEAVKVRSIVINSCCQVDETEKINITDHSSIVEPYNVKDNCCELVKVNVNNKTVSIKGGAKNSGAVKPKRVEAGDDFEVEDLPTDVPHSDPTDTHSDSADVPHSDPTDTHSDSTDGSHSELTDVHHSDPTDDPADKPRSDNSK